MVEVSLVTQKTNVQLSETVVQVSIVPTVVNVELGNAGLPGADGATGATGATGPAGPGVPAGGTTGQVLKKNSNTDFDNSWQNASGGSWGSITGTLSAQADLQTMLDAKQDKIPTITIKTGTSYTLQASDSGTILRFTNASTITLTCPNNMAVGFNVGIVQAGGGRVFFSAGSGATVANAQGYNSTFGTNAYASLLVDANSGGSAAHYILEGNVN